MVEVLPLLPYDSMLASRSSSLVCACNSEDCVFLVRLFPMLGEGVDFVDVRPLTVLILRLMNDSFLGGVGAGDLERLLFSLPIAGRSRAE